MTVRSPAKAVNHSSSGSITITSNVYMDVDPGTDAVVPARVGDLLMVTVSALWDQSNNNPATCWSAMDAVTRVSNAIVNYISGNGSGGLGVQAWFITAGSLIPASGPIFYTVQAGDIEDGKVRLRLRAKNALNTPETRGIRASAGERLQFAAVNLS